MRNNKGQFIKGVHSHPETEFKKGQHWRPPAPFREKEYLLREYVERGRSASEIAAEFGHVPQSVYYWLDKHGIPRRSVSEARKQKHWGLSGPANGMYGRTGDKNPHWKGGCTPERQAFYASIEWANASRAVWRRDNKTCQRCKVSYTRRVPFHIHHIVSFQVVELRAEISNLILLCEPCHDWVHSRRNKGKHYIRER